MQARGNQTLYVVFGILMAMTVGLVTTLAAVNYIPHADPSVSEMSNRAVSYNGIYTVYYKSELEPVQANVEHEWTLHLEKKGAGLALDNARIFVSGFMQADGHPMPVRPRADRMLGNGNYLVQGVKFDQPGDWIIYFYINFGSDYDTAEVHVTVK